MINFVRILVFVLGFVSVAPAFSVEPEFVIFRARIDSLSDDYQEPPAIVNSGTSFGTPTKATITVLEILSGQMHANESSIKLYMSAWPLKKMLKDVLFVAKRNNDGSLAAKWWEIAENGQCVPENVAQGLNLVETLSELYKSGKLKCTR